MTPTRKRLLLLIAVLGLLCGLTVSRLYLATTTMLINVRATTPVVTAVMCAALLWWTILVRRRLVHVQRALHEARKDGAPFVMRDRPLEPVVAARTLALAFAASRAGSYVCGFYLGISLIFLGHWDVTDARLRCFLALATAVFALLLVVVALWLERSCKLPRPPTPSGVDAVTP